MKRALRHKGYHLALPKFSAGQRVEITRTGGFAVPAGTYRVVRALPRERGAQQYRVKNDAETFDRVLDEVRLEAVSFD